MRDLKFTGRLTEYYKITMIIKKIKDTEKISSIFFFKKNYANSILCPKFHQLKFEKYRRVKNLQK